MTSEGPRQGSKCYYQYYHIVICPVPLIHKETTAQHGVLGCGLPAGIPPLQTSGSKAQ